MRRSATKPWYMMQPIHESRVVRGKHFRERHGLRDIEKCEMQSRIKQTLI